jgi:hypothetical protein
MPMLAQYRSLLALESGPYIGPESYVVRATSGSDTTQLVSSAYPITSGIPQQDQLVDRPLYRPTAVQPLDRHRYIMDYEPSTGTITPDLPWIFPPFSTIDGNTYEFLEGYMYGDLENFLYQDLEGMGTDGIGERFEVLGPFDVPTMHRLINDGLKQCWLVVEVPCVPTELTSRHDLAVVAPWLQDVNNVLQVGMLVEGEDRNLQDPFERRVYGRVEQDGGSFYLNTGTRTFNANDMLWLRCLKRGYDHCRPAGGAFGQQSGLELENDEAPIEREWLTSAALVLAWRRFAHLLEPAANQRLIRDRAEAAAWFSDRSHKHLGAVKPQMQFSTARHFGPAFR